MESIPTGPGLRRLEDFIRDNVDDVSSAMRDALAFGPGVVAIGPGRFRMGDVAVPPQVMIRGSGPSTIIHSNGAKAVFHASQVNQWSIRDLTLDGEAEGDWHQRRDDGRSGIQVTRCLGYDISRVRFQNFHGAGLDISYTGSWCDGGNLDHLTACGNYIGIRFNERGEYANASHLECFRNVIGCVVHAGNVKIACSNFGSNITGVLIQDMDNGSHGAISNCLINHNEQFALICRDAKNGMSITNCCFFTGRLIVENSQGVNITGGTLSCHIDVTGDRANRIAGNHIIPDKYKLNFSASTIVTDNFTNDGPL